MRIVPGIALLLALSSPALAGGLTVGASLSQTGGDEIDDTAGKGAFVRLRTGSRSALEVDLARSSPEGESYTSTRLGAALVFDLSDRATGGITPYALAGGGVTRTESQWWIGDHRHLEVGAGLDVALGRRAWLGVDARLGQRDLVRDRLPNGVVILIYAPSVPEHHDYATMRLTLSFAM